MRVQRCVFPRQCFSVLSLPPGRRLPSLNCRRWQSNAVARSGGLPPTVAIVGSGPAGFYTAQKIMRELNGTKVDMYEQLPVPFGLVRFGVAPDHPEVKNCQDTFQDVAASENFTFVGNVKMGHEIPLSTLSRNYDAIVFAYGASKDRTLGLDGEDKPHIYSARAFVGWYNGLPEYRDLDPDLSVGEDAIIVGQGNVALDVARILLTDVEVLKQTDITKHAVNALSKSTIKHVRVVGRRGPMQAAFTIKEIRELMHMEGVNFNPIPRELFPADLKSLSRPKRRILELLLKGKSEYPAAQKSWSLDFLLTPIALSWADSAADKLDAVRFTRNVLDDPSSPDSKIKITDDEMSIPTSLLFRSIGYKAEPITGMGEIGAEFDDRKGRIKHDGFGRVYPRDSEEAVSAGARLYCAGWVKRGPTGVIASTMTDAFETAEAIIEDWKSKYGGTSASATPRRGWAAVQEDVALSGLPLRPVHWDGWKAIDQAERHHGQAQGKPREKLGTVEEMLLESSNID